MNSVSAVTLYYIGCKFVIFMVLVDMTLSISMVANQKHVYPNLKLFRKRKKLIYSAMPHYIVLKLINYSNQVL